MLKCNYKEYNTAEDIMLAYQKKGGVPLYNKGGMVCFLDANTVHYHNNGKVSDYYKFDVARWITVGMSVK